MRTFFHCAVTGGLFITSATQAASYPEQDLTEFSLEQPQIADRR